MSTENNKVRILVVDDEPGMRDLLKLELETLGYGVMTAGDGQEALGWIQKEKFQLVITDIMMPKLDGLGLLEEIKKRDIYLEVIVTTGYGQVENAVQAMKRGAYDFIQKPYSPDQILTVVEKALEKGQLRRTRDAALEASRAKSEFLATMSHEIRTPLNAIIGMTELLSEASLSAEHHECVQILRRGGETLLTLINDILDLSKVESGCLELEEVHFELNEFIERTVEFMAMRAHQKGLELNCHVHPDLQSTLVGDSNRLRQVIVNLLGNAIKFTDNGEITLGVEPVIQKPSENNEKQETPIFRFSVKDTGIGIPADRVENVFDPFTQVDSSTTRKYGGTGLGLSISKKLVELMGGRLWLTSEFGKGTTFYFEVPLKVQTEVPKLFVPLTEPELKKVRTLVVDDNATNRFIIREALSGWGVAAKEAESGEACLAELKRAKLAGEAYHLILLDCRMPNMDGFQVAEAVQKDADFSNSVIMMLTSDSRQGDIARSKDLGLAGYMVKPVKRADLYEAIRIALGKGLRKSETKVKPQAESIEPEKQASKRILLVEDNEDNRMLIQLFLKAMPHKIDYAENGVVAVQKAITQEYDLILMDINMPIMGGIEATKAIREWEEKQNDGKRQPMPIVALTANALKQGLPEALQAGCNAYLTKPVKKALLIEAISKYTNREEAFKESNDDKRSIKE